MAREMVHVYRAYEYHPFDLMVAFITVVTEQYGRNAIRGHKPAWFRRRKPLTFTTVKTGIGQEAKVVQGSLEITGIPGAFTIDTENRVILAKIRTEFREHAEKLMLSVQHHLDTRSIYRGKAITSEMEFIDLSGIRADNLVYNTKVARDLKRHIWTLLEQAAVCRARGIPLRRKVLFPGTFGSGKTMAALVIAQKAVANDWLFFYIAPSTSATAAIGPTLETARRYGRAVVLIEDFDREQRESNPYAFGQLMNEIDGALSKSGELIVIMTTNYPEKLGAGIQRPGRIDKSIDFNRFLSEDAVALLQKLIPADMLAPDIRWARIAGVCEGYAPAFVNEIATSAKLAAICDDPERMQVTEEMLVEAAQDLREQHKVCTQASPGFKP